MGTFVRTVGPKVDVRELEYIAALQQTCDGETRLDATISTLDIMRFVQSRYSLLISHAQARDIVRRLGGGMLSKDARKRIADSAAEEQSSSVRTIQQHHTRWRKIELARDDNEELIHEIMSPKIEYFDLVQIESILLIPTLARYAKEWGKTRIDSLQDSGDRKKEYRKRDSTEFASVEVGLSEAGYSEAAENGTLPEKKETVDTPLDPKPDGLLEFVLRCMWRTLLADNNEMSGAPMSMMVGREPPLLTIKLVKTLLMHNGELERANDDMLVQRMVDAAKSESGRFDEKGFVRALTADLSDWEVGCEDRISTFENDVLGSEHKRQDTSSHLGEENGKQENDMARATGEDDVEKSASSVGNPEKLYTKEVLPLLRDEEESEKSDQTPVGDKTEVAGTARNTFRFIDQVVDSHGSSFAWVISWLAYLSSSTLYTALILSTDLYTYECSERDFECTFKKTLLKWMTITVSMSTFGIAVFLPLSYGNHPTDRSPCRLFVSLLFLICLVGLPSRITEGLLANPDSIKAATRYIAVSSEYTTLNYIAWTSWGTLFVYSLFHFCISIGRKIGLVEDDDGFISRITRTSHTVGSSRLKHAGTKKMNLLLQNALQMHSVPKMIPNSAGGIKSTYGISQQDPVFQNYLTQGESYEKVNMFLWTWKQLLSGRLFDTEGVWLPARLWVIQVAQIITAVFLGISIFPAIESFIEEVSRAKRELPDGLPDWMYSYVPNGEDVEAALVPAAIITTAFCVVLICLYIPSTVLTILKYRTGHYGALGNKTFHEARAAPDAAHMNTANAVYGMIAGATLFFILFGLLIFLFVWEVTAEGMMLLLAWFVGLMLTILLKVILTACCRKRFFRAFYRVAPGKANVAALSLECWYIGLGGGVLIGRLTQFLLAAAFWIGRIDQPFLAENVSLLGYKFDYVPLHYVKEILVHEAHRHPYIERLGAMYLMRLHHRDFGNTAGSCWRQLFVLTLMPWLMKHRVSHEQRCINSIKDQLSEKLVLIDEEKDPVVKVTEDVAKKGADIIEAVGEGTKQATDTGIEAVKGVIRGVVKTPEYQIETKEM